MAESELKHRAALGLLARCTVVLRKPGSDFDIGSGFFIAPGLVLTCAHVVSDCGGEPTVVGEDGQWPAVRVVTSLDRDHDGGHHEYTPYPDLALVYVGHEDHPCAWLARDDLERDDDLEVVTRIKEERGNGIAPVPLKFLQGTDTDPARAMYLAVPSADWGPRVDQGMSGSPVLDLTTLRVVGVVKGSIPHADVHLIPAAAGLDHLAMLCDADDDQDGAGGAGRVRLPNPVIEAWHRHDAYHALPGERAAGGQSTGRWPELLEQPVISATAPNGTRRSATRGVLGPRQEASLLGLLAGVEDPCVGSQALDFYHASVAGQVPGIAPGPLTCLRDAVWTLSRVGDSAGQTLGHLGSLARLAAAAASAAGEAERARSLLDWASNNVPGFVVDVDELVPLVSPPVLDVDERVSPVPPPVVGSANRISRWPAGVIVHIDACFEDHNLYRGSIRTLDSHGNWDHPLPETGRAAAFEEVLADLLVPLQAQLGRLRPARPVVEFFVPPDLYDYAFEAWRVIRGRPLGELFPVVVRDADTLSEFSQRAFAVESWERFVRCGGQPAIALSCAELPDPGDEDQAELLRFRSDDEPPSGFAGRLVVLPGPASPTGPAGPAMAALRQTWTPIAMWTRRACVHPPGDAEPECVGSQFTRAATEAVEAVPFAELPHAVSAARMSARRAALSRAGEAQDHPLAEVVLFWDPPHRIPAERILVRPGIR